MTLFFDSDIAAMDLSEVEKNGLQVYRNYSRAFDEHRAKCFSDEARLEPSVVSSLTSILRLVATEEARTLPVIACAYADDQLKEMFRREIAEGVPGGRSELLSGFGPLARLSQRIQMAFAFGWMSKDVLVEIDHLRKLRNDISHKWDLELLETKMHELIENRQHKIEKYLGDGERLPENFHESLSPIERLRVRLVWMLARVTYESHFWVPALKQNLVPNKVLYGNNRPAILSEISAACVSITGQCILWREG